MTTTTTAIMPPPKAEEFLRDILDYHGELVISSFFRSKNNPTSTTTDDDDDERWAHWKSLKYFWNLYPKADRSKYGRLCNRKRMAEVLVWTCHADPYAIGGHVEDNHIKAPAPLVQWDAWQWDRLKVVLQSLRDSLLRKDAHKAVAHVNREKPEMDRERSRMEIYNRRLEDLLAMIAANQAVSPFREQLEAGASVDRSLLMDFRKHVDHTSDRKVRMVLEQFLVSEPGGEDASSEGSSLHPTLADPDQLKQVLQAKPMNLHKFQKKLVQLILEWHSNTFQGRPPALVSLGYGDAEAEVARGVSRRDNKSSSKKHRHRSSSNKKGNDHGSDLGGAADDDNEENQPPRDDPALTERKPAAKSPAELAHMRQARKTLYERADDPFPESYETAAGATKGPTKRPTRDESSLSDPSPPPAKRSKGGGKLYERKKTAVKVQFSSDSSGDEEDEEMESIHMSDLPQRSETLNHRASSPPRRSSSGPRQRKRFTEEEKRAIREGVVKHGFGKWANIKADYSFVLNERTSVQIKDCYRTMKKNKEV